MSKLLKAKEWLTLDDTAKRLSISFGEDVTRNDVIQLCVEKKLKLSIYLVIGGAYSYYRRFCPTFLSGEDIKKTMSKLGYGNDFDFFNENTQREILLATMKETYKGFEPDSHEALYSEEHDLEGVYEIDQDEEFALFDWLSDQVLGLPEKFPSARPHELRLIFRSDGEKVYMPLVEPDSEDDPDHIGGNPDRSDFEHLLIIQTKHLIEFEQSLLGETNINGHENYSKSLSVDQLFLNVPQKRQPELLKICMKLAERHIKHEGSYPDALELWNMLVFEYEDDYDQEYRVINGLSGSSGLSAKAFRKKFDQWTKTTEIKND